MTGDAPRSMPATLVKRHIVWEIDAPRGYLMSTDSRDAAEFIPARLEARTLRHAIDGEIVTLTVSGPRVRPDGTPTASIRTLSWRFADAPAWARKIAANHNPNPKGTR